MYNKIFGHENHQNLAFNDFYDDRVTMVGVRVCGGIDRHEEKKKRNYACERLRDREGEKIR